MSLRIKTLNFPPQVLICYALLIAVFLMQLSFKSGDATTKQPDLVRDEVPRKNGYRIELVTDNSNTQAGFDCILYDGKRQVDVIHLDSTCHLYKAILFDNQ